MRLGFGLGDDEAVLTSQDDSSNELTLDGAHLVGHGANFSLMELLQGANRG